MLPCSCGPGGKCIQEAGTRKAVMVWTWLVLLQLTSLELDMSSSCHLVHLLLLLPYTGRLHFHDEPI
jgi:hypothetical protein